MLAYKYSFLYGILISIYIYINKAWFKFQNLEIIQINIISITNFIKRFLNIILKKLKKKSKVFHHLYKNDNHNHHIIIIIIIKYYLTFSIFIYYLYT